MRIFISHAFDEEDLASKLKQILEENDQITEAYMAEKSPDFEIEISDKITREIQNSDYLVAIITKTSKESPSVHQELGYAQGVNTLKIPMIETGAKIGVLLEGRDRFEFEQKTFENSCKQVLEYILTNGPKRKYTQEEAEFAQRSAHYRYMVESDLLEFLDHVIVYFELSEDDDQLFFDEKGRQKAYTVLEEFIESPNAIEKLSGFEVRKFFKVYQGFNYLQRSIENANRLPNNDLFPEEQDAIIKLKERILENSSSYINLQEVLRETFEVMNLPHAMDYDVSYNQMISKYPKIVTLTDHMRIYWMELKTLVKACVKLDKGYLKLHQKFGDVAFKDTYGDDWA